MTDTPLIQNDAVVLGIIMVILALIFGTAASSRTFWKKFYGVVPTILLAYFLPSLLATAGIISGDVSQMYFVSSRYLLPTALVLLTLSIDLKGVVRLGPKAVILFLTGTFGVVIGGPLSILLFSVISPETVGGAGPEAVWRGMTTIAGTWIGGGANQAAMKEVYEVGDQIFSAMVAVDIIVANLWMAVLLIGAARANRIDGWMKADTSAIEAVRKKVEEYQASIARMPRFHDTLAVLAVGFGVTALAHLGATGLAPFLQDNFPQLEKFSLTSTFFWLVILATTGGLILSFTRARKLEGVGASRLGSVLLYVLIASIGMKMNLMAIFENPGLFLVGLVWIAFHAGLLILVAWLMRAPLFFLAVGSQANIGGAASAPIVASAFHPALAPVGVMMAVLGYALGTYAAWLCGQLMQVAAG